jgi:hypothetical protein
MTKPLIPLPKRRPRGKAWPKGVSGNPGGMPHDGSPRLTTASKLRRETISDVRLLARDHGPTAIAKLAKIMNSETATDMAVIAACNSMLDRGWGRPPQAVELFQADAAYELKESEERAREQFYGKLIQLGIRLRITDGGERPN